MANYKTLKKITLCEPFPQSYVAIKRWVLANQDQIKVVERGKGNGKRYIVDQDDVDKLTKELLK